MFRIVTQLFCVCVIGAAALISGCSGEVDEDDLQLWKNTDKGHERIMEVIQDTRHPMEIRLRAIEILVEVNQARKALDAMNKSADTMALIEGSIPKMKKMLLQSKIRLNARDSLFLFMSVAQQRNRPDLHDSISKMVADWVAAGIDFDAKYTRENRTKIYKTFFGKLRISQLKLLDKDILDAVANLIAWNIETENLIALIIDMKDDEASAKALAALKGLEQRENLRKGDRARFLRAFIHFVASLGTDAAALYLIDLYMDRANKIRSTERLSRDPWLGEYHDNMILIARETQSKVILDRLRAGLKSANYTIRFQAALDVLKMRKQDLSLVLDAFQDDEIYPENTRQMRIDFPSFCIETVAPIGEKAVPTLVAKLTAESKVTRALSIICLKVVGAEKALPDLKKLTKSRDRKTDIRFLLGGTLSMGGLAKNAMAAIPAMAKLIKLHTDKKIDYRYFHDARIAIIKYLHIHDKTYAERCQAAVESAFKLSDEARKKKAKKTGKGGTKKDKPDVRKKGKPPAKQD